jgi:TonB family protein
MRPLTAITLAMLFVVGTLLSLPALAQQPDGQRKILNQVVPHYPELARRVNLEGTVKLTVTVAANGIAKSIQAVGGSPLLIKAAEDAVHLWKWVPAPQESQELVVMKFSAN